MNNQYNKKSRILYVDIAHIMINIKLDWAYIREQDVQAAFSKGAKGAVVTAFVEGWHLGGYQFLTYKSKETPHTTTLSFMNEDKVIADVEMGEIRAEATAFSRDLMNELSNVLNPETFPNVLKENFQDTDVEVTVFDKTRLEEMEMNGVLTVGRGSEYDPAFVELAYRGDPSKPLVALVGKGVTFDTGGISLKGGRNISDMRMDMGGAAAVAGAMQLLAKTKAKVNVIGLIQIDERVPVSKEFLTG